ncbi:N-acetylmuramidase domain-containing protein [Paraglaciecola aquimarina]|uniref:N-acetylmuramidase domain-containing protein n=1 Tax=Paraglaciecola aquimarina TaxID=1235557 RepID=A0ABU3SSN6_9ALTE|nr:N-acetylmuramidase domain-containing protein [Paraglaciecola aquimarina]MDU0353005.1 N-acetylmuramidase domain-containing protein [Paraglaciecola aquimarina]
MNTARLNVRATPSSNGKYLATLNRGAAIKTLAILDEWLEIEFNRVTAYVFARYVDLVYVSGGYLAQVNVRLLNVRATPNATAALCGQLAIDNQVWVEGQQKDWCQIRFNGNRAYVASRYLQKITATKDSDDNAGRINIADDAEDLPIPIAEHGQKLSRLTPKTILPISGSNEQRSVATVWNRWGGLLGSLSEEKNLEVACSLAILCVESSGKGFEQNNQNRMIIRFENHKFWRYWGKNNPQQYREHFRYRNDKVWLGHEWRGDPDFAWQSFHGQQHKEWQVFEFARQLDEEAAMLSISMGAPQIMGFHFERIGFQSVQEMFAAFSDDIQGQINGLFDFFSPQMLNYLQNLAFIEFAGMYNGSGQKQIYGTKIQKHYEAIVKLMPNQAN